MEFVIFSPNRAENGFTGSSAEEGMVFWKSLRGVFEAAPV
jgi:hypothetical protein